MAEAEVQDRRVGDLMKLMREMEILDKLSDPAEGMQMARQVTKKWAKDWPDPFVKGQAGYDNVVKTLEVMMSVRDVMCAAKQIYLAFLPTAMHLRVGSQTETFKYVGLDGEGRGIYCLGSADAKAAYLRWVKSEQGGRWAAHTDKDGKEPGDLCLSSPLPFDSGVWWRTDLKEAAKDVSCTAQVHDEEARSKVARSLAQVWDGTMSLEEVCKALESGLDKTSFGDQLDILTWLLEAMCEVVRKIGAGNPRKPQSSSWPEFFSSLQSLASCSDAPVWPELEKWMPGFDPEYEVTWVQCMVLTCRLLNITDIRHPLKASWLPRLCHRAFLRKWQDSNRRKARVLDLEQQKATVCEPPPQPAGVVRFVVISDTHGWDADLRLPSGDVLLHCGDVLFEGAALDDDNSVPDDLQAVLEVFASAEYKKFKWIFLIGGNHDASLHQLWARSPEKLAKHLPENLVLLQTPAPLEPALPGSGLAKLDEVTSAVEDGAVRLLPNMNLGRPSEHNTGLVIAGSGVSLANNAWSANNAFQLIKTDTNALASAAEALCKREPHVVMTHGPPKGHCDKGRGEAKLAEAIKGCSSVKVHVFGHVHEAYGTDFSDKRTWANASMSSPLYVLAAEPLMFDLPQGPSAEEINQARQTRTLRVRDLPGLLKTWDIFAHFPGTMVAAAIPPTQDSNEAWVYFELAEHAAQALQNRWNQPFGTTGRRVVLEATKVPGVQAGGAKRNWVALFDVLNTSKSGFLSREEQDAGIEAGILPKEKLYR